MTLTVVDAPSPIVLPSDIAGSHAADDAAVAAMIAAVTEEIDAPDGWLGRSLGEQQLKLVLPSFGCGDIRLPYRPVVSIASVKYLNDNLVEQTVATTVYRLADDHLLALKPGQSWPAHVDQPDAVRITYNAGYEEVPARVKQSIILMVQQLKSTSTQSGEGAFIESETVEGVGTFRYSLTSRAAEMVQQAAGNLLSGLRVWE